MHNDDLRPAEWVGSDIRIFSAQHWWEGECLMTRKPLSQIILFKRYLLLTSPALLAIDLPEK